MIILIQFHLPVTCIIDEINITITIAKTKLPHKYTVNASIETIWKSECLFSGAGFDVFI